ncbi:hypothetical protein BU16DRAFT_352483 [Lophium mytilinum]|uniref:Uncharacterized protein n=1 Tax=Lophium mytilinum TaxID=390894 RepID=A0A6A6R010_9PEZI|nr:hypothetical protein BU16DRAFT_352483 [Lophium mytilinum]
MNLPKRSFLIYILDIQVLFLRQIADLTSSRLMLLPRARFGSPLPSPPSSPPPYPPPLTRELVKSYLRGLDDSDDGGNENYSDSDESFVSSTDSSSSMPYTKSADLAFITNIPDDDCPDIKLWLEQLCQEEMSKVQWSPEYNPAIETLSCATSCASLNNMYIFLVDNISNTLEADPVFIKPSGLGMNIEGLDNCRAGLGPRPEKKLDILDSIRRPVAWNVDGEQPSASNGFDQSTALAKTVLSYDELQHELVAWSNAISADQASKIQPHEWNRNAIRVALQDKLAKMQGRIAHRKKLIRSRMHAAKIVQNEDELERLLEEKRRFSKQNFDECASEILSDISKEQRAAETQLLDELLDLTVSHAAQKELLASHYRSLPERIQMCQTATTTLQEILHRESRDMDRFLGNVDFLAIESVMRSKKAWIRARKITAQDVKPETRTEVLEKRLSNAPGTLSMMSNVYDDNKLVDDFSKCTSEICDNLLSSLQQISEAAQAQLDMYSDAYAWLGGD